MRRATGGRDQDLDAALLRGLRPFQHLLGRSMCRKDADFMGNSEFRENVDRTLEGVQVGLASHHDSNQGPFRHAAAYQSGHQWSRYSAIVQVPTIRQKG